MSNVRYTKEITDLKNSQIFPEYISLFIHLYLNRNKVTGNPVFEKYHLKAQISS